MHPKKPVILVLFPAEGGLLPATSFSPVELDSTGACRIGHYD